MASSCPQSKGRWSGTLAIFFQSQLISTHTHLARIKADAGGVQGMEGPSAGSHLIGGVCGAWTYS